MRIAGGKRTFNRADAYMFFKIHTSRHRGSTAGRWTHFGLPPLAQQTSSNINSVLPNQFITLTFANRFRSVLTSYWVSHAGIKISVFQIHTPSFMRTLIFMAAFSSFFGKLFGDDKPSYEVAEVYTAMRSGVLELNEKEMPSLKGKPIWAVLMETGLDDAGYTLVAVADGSASLYFSNGGGLIGAGEHENVRPQSLKLVEAAKENIDHMEKVEEFPMVKPGNTTFYIVTPGGVFSYTAKEADLGENRDKRFSPLFYQGHELITQIRIAEQQREAAGDGEGE